MPLVLAAAVAVGADLHRPPQAPERVGRLQVHDAEHHHQGQQQHARRQADKVGQRGGPARGLAGREGEREGLEAFPARPAQRLIELLLREEAGVAQRLVCLVLDDRSQVALGNEPVRVGGEICGRVTTGGYGYTVERIVHRTGKSRSWVYSRLKLCDLVAEAREAFLAGKISTQVALALARMPVPELMGEAVKGVLGLADREYDDVAISLPRIGELGDDFDGDAVLGAVWVSTNDPLPKELTDRFAREAQAANANYYAYLYRNYINLKEIGRAHV